LLLILVGINIFTILGNSVNNLANVFGPFIQNFMKALGYSTGTVINATSDTVSDVAKDLIELQKKVKDLKDGDSVSAKNVTNNNVVFAGSTAELFKMLKNKDDGKTIEQ
jgi:hypothetical protein